MHLRSPYVALIGRQMERLLGLLALCLRGEINYALDNSGFELGDFPVVMWFAVDYNSAALTARKSFRVKRRSRMIAGR
jgi:hypothetical protein